MESKNSILRLQEALDYAEDIIITVRDPLVVFDADLRIITTNPAFCRMLSITPEEAKGQHIFELSNGQLDIPKLRELLEELLLKNTSFENFEINAEFSGLGKRTISLNARRIISSGLKPKRILLILEDITERRRKEHDVFYSELRYRRLFETAQDGILILNAQNGEITDANPFLLNMIGYSKDELLGKKLWEIGLFKDITASHEAFQVLQEKSYVRYEDLPLETKDGQAIEVEFVSNVYAIDGEKVIQCNIRNITDRKKIERNLDKSRLAMANILSSISDGFFALDSNFTITYFNPAAEQLLGKKASEVLGHNMFEEAFPEARGSIFEANYKGVMKDRNPRFFETYFGVKPYENWYEVRAFPSENGVVVFFQVTTDRKKAELALIESEQRFREMFENHQSIMLLIEPESGRIIDSNDAACKFYGYECEDLNKMNIDEINQLPASEVKNLRYQTLTKQKNQFIFPHKQASGEIRMVEVNSSPISINNQPILFSIVNDVTSREKALKEISELNASLLQRTNDLEFINKEMEAFSYSVSHDLKAPLRSMSGFSKALFEDYNEKLDGQGKSYLRKIQESSELMAELIDDLLKLSRVTTSEIYMGDVNLSDLAEEVIALLRREAPQRKITVHIDSNMITKGDADLLRIAISNLLGNAWKFSSKVAKPRIEMGAIEQDRKPTYYVRDNGAGFDMTYADKLFQPFRRLHTSSEFAGTGIGLSIVQRIVRRHGGRIWAESQVGYGTTFYFTLGQ